MKNFSHLTWVFGYGSLMWNPGFSFLEQEPAKLKGYHRTLCIYSHHHRGTRESPGLVLGLDKGGNCSGIAFRVARENWPSIIEYLNERELVENYAYVPANVKVNLGSGAVYAYTFIANTGHPNYAGQLPIGKIVKIIRDAKGVGGGNLDYLLEVIKKLEALEQSDARLNAILQHLQENDKN